MPYLDTAQQWLTQSTLLLQARPSSTRITTKYTITPPNSRSSKKTPKIKAELDSTPTPASTTTPSAPPPATLTLKTYDPASGVALKYSTNKAAEVSRLIQILGRLARPMAGLPEMKEDVHMLGSGLGGEVAEGSGPGTPAVETVPSIVGGKAGGGQQQGGGQGGGQGGKKGKKKGKK
ncbi:hypothetical protein EG329_014137 [Mollisiaceae sp. DMI_Dod_QoI]|nr:hypothetical protein EG329_014137 [Helotiales sp. DMI_Dod_QoI]